MSHCSDEGDAGMERVGFFCFVSQMTLPYSITILHLLYLHHYISYVPVTATSKQKNIPGKLKGIIYGLEGEMSDLLNCLDIDI